MKQKKKYLPGEAKKHYKKKAEKPKAEAKKTRGRASLFKLTESERKLCEAYSGHGTLQEAAEYAGITYTYARMLINRPKIQAYLRSQDGRTEIEREARENGLIMTRLERQQMWSDVARDERINLKFRLAALEALARSECDFKEKIIHEGGDKPIEQTVTHKEISERLAEILPK